MGRIKLGVFVFFCFCLLPVIVWAGTKLSAQTAATAVETTDKMAITRGTTPYAVTVGTIEAAGQYHNIVRVEEGESIQAAIDAITDATATNPYLIRISPGVFDLGTGTINGENYVSYQGSGIGVTIITSSNTNHTVSFPGSLPGTGSISDMTIENTGVGLGECFALIYSNPSDSPGIILRNLLLKSKKVALHEHNEHIGFVRLYNVNILIDSEYTAGPVIGAELNMCNYVEWHGGTIEVSANSTQLIQGIHADIAPEQRINLRGLTVKVTQSGAGNAYGVYSDTPYNEGINLFRCHVTASSVGGTAYDLYHHEDAWSSFNVYGCKYSTSFGTIGGYKRFHLGTLASAPSNPNEGETYTNSVSNNIYCYINSGWRQLNN